MVQRKCVFFFNVSSGSQEILIQEQSLIHDKLLWCDIYSIFFILGVITVGNWRRTDIILFSTYICGKTRTKFINLIKDTSYLAHHSGPTLVDNWKEKWKIKIVDQCYVLGICNFFTKFVFTAVQWRNLRLVLLVSWKKWSVCIQLKQ